MSKIISVNFMIWFRFRSKYMIGIMYLPFGNHARA
jgi:hypothetical protein